MSSVPPSCSRLAPSCSRRGSRTYRANGTQHSILTKTEQLTRDESALMREHVTRGAEIVSKFPSFRAAIPVLRHHHERWDGLGYPDGLAADDIPLEAAIIGLADAWDAM